MARIMVIDLTESGTKTEVNEDSFCCVGHVYPNMITGSDEQTLGAFNYTQVNVVTQMFSRSGADDPASRITQRFTKTKSIRRITIKTLADPVQALAPC